MTDSVLSNPLAGHPVLDQQVLTGFHLLEADAGTGKTWTIARLVLRVLLERELTIDQIVVVTFTNAAAAELKDRIARLLDAWSMGRPADDDPFSAAYSLEMPSDQLVRIVRQARLQLDDAPIHTIHGFCQRILAEQAMSLGQWGEIEPGFNDTDAMAEAVAHWWRANIVHGAPERSLLIGKHGLSFERLVLLLSAAQSCPDAEISVNADDDWSTLAARMAAQVQIARDLIVSQEAELADWMGDKANLSQSTYPVAKLDERLAGLKAWLDGFPMTVDNEEPALALFDSRRFSVKKGGADRLGEFSVLEAVSQLNDLRVERSYVAQTVAAQIRDSVFEALERRKRDARQITFDDLLHRTRRALQDPEHGDSLAQGLALRFPLALIDEFQDTDPTQWTIFSQIYQPGLNGPASARPDCGLVLVGDPKQAIYSFRHADVWTYLNAREQGAVTHRLGQNQRSSRPLINAVNRLFERTQAFAMPQITFAAAQCGPNADAPARSAPDDELGVLNFVQLSGADDPELQATNKAELNRRATQTCCLQIQQLLSMPSAKEHPAVNAHDIAILVRRLDQGRQVKQQLASAGIGAVEVSRDSVLLSNEATDLLRVLAAVAEPADDRLVRGALMTALLGFSVSDLHNMDLEPALWDQRFQAFAVCQRLWLRQGPEASLRDLVFGVFDRAQVLVGLSGGERRMTNLLHLFELLGDNESARESAAQARATLSRQRQQAIDTRGRDGATEVRLESDDQLVRILTIHGSKGLEFPIVFLPFVWSGGAGFPDPVLISETTEARPRQISLKHSLDLFKNPKWGIVPDTENSPDRLGGQAAIRAAQENLRLTYVALTRASSRCYVYWAYPEALKGKQLEPTRVEASGLGYLLDDQSVLTVKPDVQKVTARLQALAQEQPGVSLVTWPQIQAAMTTIEPSPRPDDSREIGNVRRAGWPAADQMVLASLARQIPEPWRTSSFTSLMAAGTHDMAATEEQAAGQRPDHDQMLARQLIVAGQADHADLRSRFVRGANAGSCLHQILEQIDFRDPVPVDLVERTLERFSIDTQTQSPGQIAAWLDEVLAAALPDPRSQESIVLNRIPPADAIAELDYLMPVDGTNAVSLAQAVRQEYPLPAQLSAARISGYMNGFIDLIVRSGDVHYVIDWKSNWLGADAGVYIREAMEHSVAEHGYALQFCLYTLALHRWLRRSIANYDYERHVGGVHYLFLRGAGASGLSVGHGVYSTRPSRALIEQMDSLLKGAGHD